MVILKAFIITKNQLLPSFSGKQKLTSGFNWIGDILLHALCSVSCFLFYKWCKHTKNFINSQSKKNTLGMLLRWVQWGLPSLSGMLFVFLSHVLLPPSSSACRDVQGQRISGTRKGKVRNTPNAVGNGVLCSLLASVTVQPTVTLVWHWWCWAGPVSQLGFPMAFVARAHFLD